MSDQTQLDEPKPQSGNDIGPEIGPEISLTSIREYIWARYVDNEWDRDIEHDEEALLAQLSAHYEEHTPETDPEVWYYGVLLFERSFHTEDPAARREVLLQSKGNIPKTYV